MANPTEHAVINDIEFMLGRAVNPVVAMPSAVERFLKKRFSGLDDSSEHMEVMESINKIEIVEAEAEEIDLNRLRSAGETPAIIRTVNQIVLDGIKTGAASIHIEPRDKDILVRYRIEGILQNPTAYPIQAHPAIISRLKAMARLEVGIRHKPQYGATKVRMKDREIELHVSTLPTLYGEKSVIKLTGEIDRLRNLDHLGMLPGNVSRYRNLLQRPQGVIFVTGPALSGKSVTLQATLRSLRSEEQNVVTVEEAIECRIPGINQVQMKDMAGVSFDEVLQSVLRQDPDVIMVDPVDGRERSGKIMQASLTGRIVLSALHARTGVSALVWLRDIGVKPFLVASSVIGTVSQRLVRRYCRHCLKKYVPDPDVLDGFKFESLETWGMKFYRGEGCEKCNHTGYSRQIGIFELLVIDEDLKKLILEEAPEDVLFAKARENGMTTLEENGLFLALNKVTTLEEVLKNLTPLEIEPKIKDTWEKKIMSQFDELVDIV